MNVRDAIRTRRSVKVFDPTQPLSEEEVQCLMQQAILSPTAFNLQHWRFVRARDPELRAEIRKVAWDQPQVTDAPLLLIVCMDLMAWEKNPERYWRNVAPETRDVILPTIHQYYAGYPQRQRDEGMRSCAIAAMAIMLTARDMGYDSCPMDGFDFEAVARIINLPPDHAICMMIAVGKAVQEPWPRSGQLRLDQVMVTDRFESRT